MRILIRCLWMPLQDTPTAARLAEIADVGNTTTLLTLVGPRWYKLGRSRKDALKHEVRLGEVHTNKKFCRRVPLIEGEAYWALDVWNGRPEQEAANVHFSVYDPPNHLDIFFVSFERASLPGTVSWDQVLSTARQLSERLGGHAIVTSNELRERAEQQKIAGAEHFACAAFWGLDRSGRNPLYRWLATTGRKPPTELVLCHSWQEMNSLDGARLQAFTECMAAVAAAAGEGDRT